MPGRGTAEAVFVLRRLNEKFIAKNKKLFFIFVNLEKTFDGFQGKLLVLL